MLKLPALGGGGSLWLRSPLDLSEALWINFLTELLRATMLAYACLKSWKVIAVSLTTCGT